MDNAQTQWPVKRKATPSTIQRRNVPKESETRSPIACTISPTPLMILNRLFASADEGVGARIMPVQNSSLDRPRIAFRRYCSHTWDRYCIYSQNNTRHQNALLFKCVNLNKVFINDGFVLQNNQPNADPNYRIAQHTVQRPHARRITHQAHPQHRRASDSPTTRFFEQRPKISSSQSSPKDNVPPVITGTALRRGI